MSIRRWFLVMLLVGPSTAFSYTGNELLEHCASEQPTEQAFCMGYIDGVDSGFKMGLDAAVDLLTDIPKPQRQARGMYLYCMPSRVTRFQTRDIVLKWLRENPKERHKPAAVLTVAALTDAYPCP
jgi:hypothetical protein